MDSANYPPGRTLGRRGFLQSVGLGGAGALLAACQQPPPGAAPAATPAEPAAPAARPAEAAADWEQAWSSLVEAARREGRVVVSGPPTPETRTQRAGWACSPESEHEQEHRTASSS